MIESDKIKKFVADKEKEERKYNIAIKGMTLAKNMRDNRKNNRSFVKR